MTVDHKPDLPGEHRRIMSCGGSVEYLHNHDNKPFIRGGDFGERKANGETPMQLQYSRAFGVRNKQEIDTQIDRDRETEREPAAGSRREAASCHLGCGAGGVLGCFRERT